MVHYSYNKYEDEFIDNLTKDLRLAMEDAGVSMEEAAETLDVRDFELEWMLEGAEYMELEHILRLCHLCGAEVEFRVSIDGKNVREDK